MGGSVINDKGCMGGIWFLAVILVGFEINRKNGGISLTIAFGATRKNAFIGFPSYVIILPLVEFTASLILFQYSFLFFSSHFCNLSSFDIHA